MENDFVTWLTTELDRRGWSNSELARRADMVPSTISMVISERNSPSLEFCVKVAHAFGIRDVDVLRQAELIDPVLPAVAREERATQLIRSMSENGQQTAIEVLESLARGDARDARATGERRTRDARHTHNPGAARHLPDDSIFEVEAAFEDQLALLSPTAPDSAERHIVIRAIARVWDEGTRDDRVFLARLFDALVSMRREERREQQANSEQLAPVGE